MNEYNLKFVNAGVWMETAKFIELVDRASRTLRPRRQGDAGHKRARFYNRGKKRRMISGNHEHFCPECQKYWDCPGNHALRPAGQNPLPRLFPEKKRQA